MYLGREKGKKYNLVTNAFLFMGFLPENFSDKFSGETELCW